MPFRDGDDRASVIFDDVSKRYPGPPPVTALSEIRLRVDRHRHTVITGPSGSGKSTLVNIIGALDVVTSGRVSIDGHDLTDADERERAWLRRTKLGFVFQSSHLLPDRSVVENVELALILRDGRAKPGHRSKAREALAAVGLDARWSADTRHLSGGESQRVAIARALVKQPSLIIMDEPTGNLDSHSAKRVLDLVRDVLSFGITVITVTHDPIVRAAGDTVITMRDGRVEVGQATHG